MKKKYLSLNNFGAFLYISFLLLATPAEANVKELSKVSYGVEKLSILPKPVFLNDYGSFSINVKNQKQTIDQIATNFTQWLDLDSNHSFVEVKKTTDHLKMTHTHFQHYYKGIAIEGELILVHAKDNIVQSINGQVTALKEVSIENNVSDEKAFSLAKAALQVGETQGDYPVTTVFTKFETERGTVETKLTKKVRIDSFEPVLMMQVYIDAKTGEWVKKVNLIHDADVNATAQTYYRGNQTIVVDSFLGGYRLRDNGRKIETYDATNAKFGSAALLRDLSDVVSTSTTFSVDPALDAHWGMEQTYDYYKVVFNRDSYDDNGGVIKNYYNAKILEMIMPSSGYPNNAGAFPAPYNVMVYGRGDGTNMGPVVGLDVAGHEFTHMVVENNGSNGLEYLGESGALNESFADIFGTAIEFFVNLNPNWIIGEDVMLNNGAGMRDMSNPKLANNPNTYKGQYWINTNSTFDNGGVHINSGVQNHWFYLLSVGGSGMNDLNNSYNVNGIGIDKAEKIAYRNLTTYLTNTATYLDAYKGSLQAAIDLYGDNSSEYEAVLEAWYAVGIGDKLSVDKAEIKSSLKVYPNPSKGQKVFVNSEFDGVGSVEVYDLMGKRVLKATELNRGENSIDVQSLSNGVYFLKFNMNGQVHSEKLMINN